MVVLLNAVWVLLSLAAVWVWLQLRRGGSRYSFSVQFFALSCALVILFPVVSANDDLCVEQAAIETTERQKSFSIEAGKSIRHSFHVPFVCSLPELGFATHRRVVLAMAAKYEISLRSVSILSLPYLDRAPPIPSLA